MLKALRILSLIAAGILVCGVGGFAGLCAALTDWNWRSATSGSQIALPNEAASPRDLAQNLTNEKQQTYVVQDRAVGAEILQTGNVRRAALLPSPGSQLWYLPGLTVSIIPPDDNPAAFDLTAFQPWNATLLATGPEQSQPSWASIQTPRVSANRPRSVLNDAQIASVKARLKLTSEQERMWPPVEVALRNLSYEKGAFARARSARDGDRIASIDLDGPEVQQLKKAVVPLIARLSEDQKREVKSLAHVMGLDGVVASF
jgi:hypothetical protein